MSEKYMSAEEHHANRGQKSNQINYLKPALMVVGVLLIAGLSFFGGIKYQKNHQKTVVASNASLSGQAGSFGGGRRFNGQRPTFGQVTAINTTSITVQNQSGTNTTLAITSATAISDNGQTVTSSDIKVGDTVAVVANSSDSSQASRILVNPSFGGGSGAGSPPKSAN